jgi:hypothetical protein
MSTPVPAQARPQPSEQLLQMTTGYMVSAALHTTATLGIADLLKNGAKSTRELAAACSVNEDALYRVMRALASMDVFNEVSARTFELAPVGELLRSDREDSFRNMVLWMGCPMHFDTYQEMLHAVKTGETVVEKVYGVSCFGYFEKDEETGKVFNAAMTTFSKVLTPALLEAYDFSWLNGKTLVDIGGGHGELLTAILKKFPEVRGAIFDLEHVRVGADARIQELGLSDRCHSAGGDFFESVPAADAYIMKHIIHDWNDERALTILKNCHRAGKDKARVILAEGILTPGNEPDFGKWLDLEMLLLPGGRERTEEEFRQLFERGGFRLTRVVRTKSLVCMLEAEKVA